MRRASQQIAAVRSACLLCMLLCHRPALSSGDATAPSPPPQPQLGAADGEPHAGQPLVSWSRFRAVTVVHRPCSTLSFTLTNVAGNLGGEWSILLIYTPGAAAAVNTNKIVRRLSRQGRLAMVKLSDLHIPKLSDLSSVRAYSRLLTRPQFWQAIHADKALIFQADSVICSGSRFRIDDFLGYDYVGAPWIKEVDPGRPGQVGNGGLSLRSVAIMLRITKKYIGDLSIHPEDYFFVDAMQDMVSKDNASVILAPTSVAEKFSWEAGKPRAFIPFGVHRYVEVPNNHRAVVIKACPEAGIGVWASCGRGPGGFMETVDVN